jgi:transitional endoplasmic reticulum ATPase
VGIIEAQARMQGATLDRGVATWLADNTNDYSAADLEALVMKGRKLAGRAGHKSVTLADMQQAHRLIRSESPQMADYYTRLAIAACNDAEFLPPEYAALLDDRAALEQSIEAAEPASQRRQRRDSAGW